jgi:hypothetical protein
MKFFMASLILVSVSFVGCIGGPKKINFNDLASNVFTLTRISYMTNTEEYNQDIPKIFNSLPIQNVVEQIELKYGVSIDTSLFENAENNVSQIKSYNTASGGLMPNYHVEYDSTASQKVTIFLANFKKEN